MASIATTPSAPKPVVAGGPPNQLIPAALLTALIAAIIGGIVWVAWYITHLQSTATQETKFVFRRFEEPAKLLGREFNPYWVWIPVVTVALVLGLAYIVWMYVRDGRTVGWLWATFLGALRFTVYAILAAVFLMPALQTWERNELRSKVLLLIDVTGSMRITDEIPDGSIPVEKLPTRMDKVRQLLTSDQAGFIKALLDKNPVAVYAFGGRLDEDAKLLQKGGEQWSAADWSAWLNLDVKHWVLDELSEADKEILRSSPAFEGDKGASPVDWATAWLKLPDEKAIPTQKPDDATKTLSDAGREKLLAKRAKLQKKLDVRAQVVEGTNLGDSLLAAYNREANNMLSGIVVISDGRSNQGSDQAFVELQARAHKARVPIFTVGVGEDRQKVSIVLTSLQGPAQAPPDEKFAIMADVDGAGLADREFPIFVDVYKPKSDPKTDKPALTLTGTGKFKPGEPPHGQVEIPIDPNSDALAPIAVKGEGAGARGELPEGEWTFVPRVPREKREVFPDKEHVGPPTVVNIVKKPLRVLLFAGGPGREYQFVIRMFANAVEKKLADMSVYLQVGKEGERVQDVDPSRLLKNFPTYFDAEQTEGESKYYNLAQYDLIIAFDPDWTQLEPKQMEILKKWVEDQAGGLICVGGAVNTYHLGVGLNYERLKPILDLYPVSLADNRLGALDLGRRPTTDAWPLRFPNVTSEMEYLKLDEDNKDVLAGWNEFFKTGRGFYNYYPVKSVKPGATVIATFGDPRANMPDGKEQPFLVTQQVGKGIVVYVSSGEMWRLRDFKEGEVRHERFWTKLGRYASANTRTRITRRGVPVIGKNFTTGRYIPIAVQLFDTTLGPLPQSARPKATLIPPAGVTLGKTEINLLPRPVADARDWEGYFQGRFEPLREPGDYEVEIPVPNSKDEKLRHKFRVTKADVEMDNTRPDFGQLYQVASDVNDLRVDDRIKNRIKQTVKAPRLPADEKSKAKEDASKDRDTYRLFFDLTSAPLIPECMTFDLKTQSSRGPVDDLWDDGQTFSTETSAALAQYLPWILGGIGGLLALLGIRWLLRDAQVLGATCLVGGLLLIPLAYWVSTILKPLAGTDVKIATLLWIIVGLLSIEWLTRKLLKLA
jgi:hypothetical protein